MAYVFITNRYQGTIKDGRKGHFTWVNNANLANIDLYPGDRIYLDCLNKYKFLQPNLYMLDTISNLIIY